MNHTICFYLSRLCLITLFFLTYTCSDDPGAINGAGTGQLGEVCVQPADCDPALTCSSAKKCARRGDDGTKQAGDGCSISAECQSDLVCASYRQCASPGVSAEGAPCQGNEVCAKGLICSGEKKCAAPGAVGTKGINDTCKKTTECALGLVCLDLKCTPISYWAGAKCVPDDGVARAYFEIPRPNSAIADFYRLPFPNDIRRKNGRVDVTGHPTPAGTVAPNVAALVDEIIKGINQDVTGWGLNTTTFLRLSTSANLKTVTISGDTPTVQFINIDKSSAAYGQSIGFTMYATTERTPYICTDWIAVRPNIGAPLSPKTTYAVLLRSGIQSDTGTAFAQDKDFKVMLSATAPSDAVEKQAWLAYAPLRSYLSEQKLAASSVLSAAVFTTMDAMEKVRRIQQVTAAAADTAPPTLTQLTHCNGTQKSPCEDASVGSDDSRDCPSSTSNAFDELHGIYQGPVFQAGKRPYKAATDGGAVAFNSDGNPTIQRAEKMCLGMSLPKTQMPTDGWPVVIYGHGTGGNFRSFVREGLARAIGDIKDAQGQPLSNVAVVSTDAVLHGPRRQSTDDPSILFFNLLNPRAARDNIFQGVADKVQLVKLVKTLNVASGQSPTGEAIKFNPNKIYFYGHSQGSVEGIPFVAVQPDITTTVFSGAGGLMMQSLLEKTQPTNIAALLKFALADPDLSVNHPLLNLLQLFFEEVDAINFGRAALMGDPTGSRPRHTFVSYGLFDGYTPPSTIEALGKAMGLTMVDQFLKDKANFLLVNPPLKENVVIGTKKVTAALVPYTSEGSYDDHFVIFDHPAAKKQSTNFIGTAARDDAPTIIAP